MSKPKHPCFRYLINKNHPSAIISEQFYNRVMEKERNGIVLPGFVGVIIFMALLAGVIFLLTKTMEWLTTVFTTPQLIFAFAMFVPAAFLIRYLTAGALVFNLNELEAMEAGITVFLFLFFGVGFFMISQIFMPESINEAYDKGGFLSIVIGTSCGLLMMACFKWFYKKLKVKSKLRSNLEGYRLPKSKE